MSMAHFAETDFSEFKFYKGEQENPYERQLDSKDLSGMLWFAEKIVAEQYDDWAASNPNLKGAALIRDGVFNVIARHAPYELDEAVRQYDAKEVAQEPLQPGCAVYRGEERPTFDRLTDQYDAVFWNGEMMYRTWPEYKIQEAVGFLSNCGLQDCGNGIDIKLIACIFSYWCRYSDCDPMRLAESFRSNVLPAYREKIKSEPSDRLSTI